MARTSTDLHVDTLSIEGALFTAEWLAKVAASQAALQTDADYGVRAGFSLREEIGFAWRSAQSLWRQFDQARQQPGSDAWGISQRFATELLRQCFAFQLTQHSAPMVVAERNYPVQFRALDERVPVVVSPHDEAKPLDTAHDRLGDNSGERIRRRSAFGLLQESLNALPNALWGVATNGLQLRIARDNASLTRPTWVQVDLEGMFTEERYADFSVLWLLLHATRFGSQGSASTDCALEQWRNACREQGTRARETLRGGVEAALLALGQGFVSHPANTSLREALATGRLSPQDYLRELLRLVYRQIFLLTVEEREILHRTDANRQAVALYAEGYSLRRLRERAVRRSAHDRHGDLWQALKQVWLGLAVGESLLALPPLGGLFESTQCPSLDACKLENRHLLNALFHLAWLRPEANAPLTRVNWRDMGPEELGSIYESLLELVPMLRNEHREFGFHTGAATRGNARKTTGSYYTHDSLVQEQLDSALEPVIAAILAAHPVGEEAVQALLTMSVIDPACGSGHFLLAATRRIAGHLARVRAQMRDAQLGSSGQPTPDDYRHALRDVVTHCVYGVDMNPMALELARMALWLEAYTPDAPLGFIDHHFQLGNALLGVMDPKVIMDGVPDDAYKELTGDNNALCRDLKIKNKKERTGLQRMREAANFSQSLKQMDLATTALPLQQLDELPDASLAEIATKRQTYVALQQGASDDGLTLALHLYCAAFLLPKTGHSAEDTSVPTTQDVINALLGQPVAARKREAAQRLAQTTPLLHWKIGFAQVFARGGFTVILANPPWDQSQFNDVEFFSNRHPEISELAGDKRKKAIALLEKHETLLWAEFQDRTRQVESHNLFYRGSKRYPLTAIGKINTYPLFAETCLNILHEKGQAGLVLPSGIATDESTSTFFSEICKGKVVRLVDFENKHGLFPGVHRNYKFCLLTIGHANVMSFAFYLTNTKEIKDERRFFELDSDEILEINPNTLTCPMFRSQHDAKIAKALYKKTGIFINENKTNGNPWGVSFKQGLFNMTSGSIHFRDASRKAELTDPVPLYEAKMIDFYNHRFGSYHNRSDERGSRVLPVTDETSYVDPSYLVTPYYWVERKEVEDAIPVKWNHKWLFSFRDVTSATNERTVIGSIIPRVGVGHTSPLIFPASVKIGRYEGETVAASLILANLLSLPLDYIARLKIGGLHLTYIYLKQLPILPPSLYSTKDVDEIIPRVLELSYSAVDLKSFYDDVVSINPAWDNRIDSGRGQPWPWSNERRQILRAELDAIYARMYGLNRDELSFIIDPSEVFGDEYPSQTFSGLKRNEVKEYGEFRSRRLILKSWDDLKHF